jgi:hypothetical protein
MNEDICIKRFFNGARLSWFKVYHIFTMFSLEYREFRSVRISKLAYMVPELHARIFFMSVFFVFFFVSLPVSIFRFLTVGANSVMTVENFHFLYFKKLLNEKCSWYRLSVFFGNKSRDTSQSLYFFWQCTDVNQLSLKIIENSAPFTNCVNGLLGHAGKHRTVP